MLPLTSETLLDLGTTFIFYFTVGSFGAFLKDLHDSMTKKNDKIQVGEVLIGGATATLICLGLQDNWFKDFSLNTMLLITFVLGVLGFEIFGNIKTLTKFENFVERVLEFKNRFSVTYENPNKKNEDTTDAEHTNEEESSNKEVDKDKKN